MGIFFLVCPLLSAVDENNDDDDVSVISLLYVSSDQTVCRGKWAPDVRRRPITPQILYLHYVRRVELSVSTGLATVRGRTSAAHLPGQMVRERVPFLVKLAAEYGMW